MSSAYFVPFLGMPELITGPGKYVTRCGDIVSIQKVSAKQNFGCHGHYPHGIAESWHKSGRLYANRECDNDIVGAV